MNILLLSVTISRLRLCALFAFCVVSVCAMSAAGEKMRIAVAPVPSAAEMENQSADAARVAVRIEEHLFNSGFFDVVDRSEASLAAALEELQFARDFSFQPDDADRESRAGFGKIADVRYLVFVALEDSQNRGNPRAEYRAARIPERTFRTLGLRIMDVESMRLVHARTKDYRSGGKDPVDDLARDAVAQVVDALYPFQIIARMGERLYFNRGAETNAHVGDRVELFQASSVQDSATGNVLTVEAPIAEVVVDRAQDWVCEAVLSDPALMAKVSESTRAKIIAPSAASPGVPEAGTPTLDW